MLALTILQPWAYAIRHLGKDIENRMRRHLGAPPLPDTPNGRSLLANRGLAYCSNYTREEVMATKLSIWHDDVNFIIAESAERARAILMEGSGCTEDEAGDIENWSAWPDDEPFMFVDDEADPREQTRTGAEWCALKGPGYFACTEH